MTRHDQAKPETWKTNIPSNLQPAEQTISVKLNLNTTTNQKQAKHNSNPSLLEFFLFGMPITMRTPISSAIRNSSRVPMCENCLERRMLCPRQGLCPFCLLLALLLVSLLPSFAVWKRDKKGILCQTICQTHVASGARVCAARAETPHEKGTHARNERKFNFNFII